MKTVEAAKVSTIYQQFLFKFPQQFYQTISSLQDLMLDPASDAYSKTPYPFGMDPVWQVAENKIIFQNAYKMKISIIFGVFHMLFGVLLSLWNFR